MKKLFFLGLVASFFFGTHSVQASAIDNVSALYTTDSKIFLQWDHLDDSLLFDTEGYALQYSEYENKVRNVDPGTLFLSKKLNYITLRPGATFAENTWYYFRVYTYVIDGRSRVLTNGSKILKWKYLSNGETESEIIEANDPVVSDISADIGIEFGKLRVTRYDTYATFSWSRPNLAKSDATGVVVVLNESGSANTLVELEAGLDITSGKVTGLTPETTYEVKGYFYKYVGGEDQKFGVGTTEIFTTQKAYSAAEKDRIDRLRERGLIHDNALTTVSVPGSEEVIIPDTSVENIAPVAPAPVVIPVAVPSTISTSSTYTQTQIEKKIENLERELQTWRLKLKQLGTNSNSSFNSTTPTQPLYPDYGSSSTTRTTAIKKPRETLRERMCRVLKLNCK